MLSRKLLIGIFGFVAAAMLAVVAFFVLDSRAEKAREAEAVASVQIEEITLPPVSEMLQERVLGNADISLYVVSSFTCGHCANFHKNIFPLLKREYVDTGKIQIVYADYPLDAPAFAATMISRCVPREHYWNFVDSLFANQAKWGYSANVQGALISYARLTGLKEVNAKACLESRDLLYGLSERRQQLSDIYSINSTPSFIIRKGDRFTIVKELHRYEQLQKAIDEF